jgi:SAM-dependent methyltransferase/uncharacterized protein YbaR (Trm112 family)
MFISTLDHLCCPSKKCRTFKVPQEHSELLRLDAEKRVGDEIISGTLSCLKCKNRYPIMAGVAVLVEDVRDYLLSHVKGIAREVPQSSFPKLYRSEMAAAFREIQTEHIEEDLESERVTALYVMTQYLKAKDLSEFSESPEILTMIRSYWDRGPFNKIRTGLSDLALPKRFSFVELGCGVGGLLSALSSDLTGDSTGDLTRDLTGNSLSSYLGVDYSFASIVLARKFALGEYHGSQKSLAKDEFQVPGDLLHGAVSRDISGIMEHRRAPRSQADFVVMDVTSSGLRASHWDACAALNIIDMLDRPEDLAKLQKRLLKKNGLAIESSPYVWHPEAAKQLRKKFPKARDSNEAVSGIYQALGFRIEKSEPHIPWLFFKHSRQIELYSVHLLFARMGA